ncbi:MAG: hypothetical protein MUO43_13015 [Desulfobacterales bacterium]|nr:hypothetical protein [Desulfobacterales bacterium]
MPESSYFIRELERKIGEDAKNISRELNNLENIGLLRSEKRGLQKFYSTKTDFLFYSELKAVFLKASGLERLFRDVFEAQDGIEKVFMKELPSSQNRGPQLIKLLFVGKPDLAVLNNAVNDLMEKSGREIIYRCYTQEEFDDRLRMEDAYILEITQGNKII